MISCDCIQGTEENGWHETTGPICEERERQEWRRVAEWLKSEEYQRLLEMWGRGSEC